METTPQINPLDVGMHLAAIGLIFGAMMLFLTGTAGSLGGSFRSAIEPVLRLIRDRSSMSRSELADITIVLSSALAAGAAVLDVNVLSGLVAGGLWLARPSIRRATREENKMLAIGGYLSIDLIIGIYTPIMLAQLLLANFMLASSLLGVVVALSWPAGEGGTSIPGRRWQLAPVASS